MREAGATAVQEVAFTLANALEYVGAARRRGARDRRLRRRDSRSSSPATTICSRRPRSSARLAGSGPAWCASGFSADEATAASCGSTPRPAGVTLQAQQPLNNVVRVAVQALGRRAGRHPVAAHQRLRRGALAADCGVGDTGTPHAAGPGIRDRARQCRRSAGRAAITWNRSPIPSSAAARALIAEVDAEGGAARAIERGFFQEAIARSAYELQKEQESGDRVVVGVNRFSDGSPPLSIQTPDFTALEQQQRSSLAEVRRRRDARKVRATLDALQQAAAGTDRLMPVDH